MSLLIFIAVIFVIIAVGGGGFALLYMKMRPKTRHYTAMCYQISDGIKQKIKDKDGNIVLDIKLNDLIPYTKDILVKKETDTQTTYHLQKQDISTNAVTADMVENWGTEKIVHVAIINDQATVLKKGIHKKSTTVVFNPMPRERVDLIISEMVKKKERRRQEKNVWQQITTWIVAGILMIGTVAGIFLTVDGQVKINEKTTEATKYAADKQIEASKNYLQATQTINNNMEKKDNIQLGKVKDDQNG